ncbi:acyl-CoA carboxylase subunit epsilon [Natronosporangium hydrolyticum]|uniref:Acyl-CoA carboxylase subunit epsilon n=1 Tax=Natronosporangium hydrolyticum TaxID=2811111 RepID=A0A895YK97_9ACTN|nr:acyl-CoA carboxylase subunit epsilon [Natronosporangium hydrolyticum]QSB15919.1 acyl-CoA carboxylase subunit epsilon [Natronosporangium hydrolyticum]
MAHWYRILRGDPTPDELAALTSVLAVIVASRVAAADAGRAEPRRGRSGPRWRRLGPVSHYRNPVSWQRLG